MSVCKFFCETDWKFFNSEFHLIINSPMKLNSNDLDFDFLNKIDATAIKYTIIVLLSLTLLVLLQLAYSIPKTFISRFAVVDHLNTKCQRMRFALFLSIFLKISLLLLAIYIKFTTNEALFNLPVLGFKYFWPLFFVCETSAMAYIIFVANRTYTKFHKMARSQENLISYNPLFSTGFTIVLTLVFLYTEKWKNLLAIIAILVQFHDPYLSCEYLRRVLDLNNLSGKKGVENIVS